MRPTGVSVLIVAHDAERFIGEALASVFAQTVLPSQVVVVDDGSTDATASIAAAAPGVTVLRRAHEGISASRNAGIAECQGEYLAFLDADDIWLPRKLERQLVALSVPGVQAVFCRADEFWDSDAPIAGSGVRAPLTGVDAPMTSALLVHRSVVDLIGPFSADPVGDWIDWWARARSLGVNEVVVPEVLLRRRLHDENNSSRQSTRARPVLLQTVRAHLRSTPPKSP